MAIKFNKIFSNWGLVIIITVLFTIWMLFFELYDYKQIQELEKKVRLLEEERDLYKQKIAQDSLIINGLNDSAFVEKYARENFLMRRENEKIYIVK